MLLKAPAANIYACYVVNQLVVLTCSRCDYMLTIMNVHIFSSFILSRILNLDVEFTKFDCFHHRLDHIRQFFLCRNLNVRYAGL